MVYLMSQEETPCQVPTVCTFTPLLFELRYMVNGTSNMPWFTTNVARMILRGAALTGKVAVYWIPYSVVSPQVQVLPVKTSALNLLSTTNGTPAVRGEGRKTVLIPEYRYDSAYH